jgi:hypothetical protein
MLRVLGRLIWSQSRDIRVLNYPGTMVYEIYTNGGYLRIGVDKDTNELYKVDELPLRTDMSQTFKSVENKNKTVFLSTLK